MDLDDREVEQPLGVLPSLNPVAASEKRLGLLHEGVLHGGLVEQVGDELSNLLILRVESQASLERRDRFLPSPFASKELA